MPKPPIIPPNMLLFDRYGTAWRAAPSYQDRDTSASGWLLLREDQGREEEFSAVVDLYGFEDEDRRYLRAVINDA